MRTGGGEFPAGDRALVSEGTTAAVSGRDSRVAETPHGFGRDRFGRGGLSVAAVRAGRRTHPAHRRLSPRFQQLWRLFFSADDSLRHQRISHAASCAGAAARGRTGGGVETRSEERRVGKECRSGWWGDVGK